MLEMLRDFQRHSNRGNGASEIKDWTGRETPRRQLKTDTEKKMRLQKYLKERLGTCWIEISDRRIGIQEGQTVA